MLGFLEPEPLIRKKTLAERDAENRWWLSLSKEQRQEWLDRRHQERTDAERFRNVVLGVGLVVYIVMALIPAVVMAARLL